MTVPSGVVMAEYVVRAEAVDEGDGVATAHVELAHVRHVEETAGAARAQVLFDRARRVLDGHVPAAEVHHARAESSVRGVQGRLFE
jgi:hypothetical protein